MELKIQKNTSLANFSTFKIGGKADYFFLAKSKKDIIAAATWAKYKKIPFFILGGGSNVLFSDKGFNGLVIKAQNTKHKIKNTKIIAEAGCPLQKLVQESIKNGLAGLEWAVGIPGTLGGAIRGNAGAFGGEMKDIIEKVKILEVGKYKLKIRELKNSECKFGYRESIFKIKKNWIILEAILNLKKGNKKELENIAKEFLKKRKEKQPLEYPSAGSVFKNVPLEKVPPRILEKFKEKIKKDPFPLLPAVVLIAETNLFGSIVGGAKISKKHPNFIINFKEANAKDILSLIKLIKKKVKQKFGVTLEEEIELVGF